MPLLINGKLVRVLQYVAIVYGSGMQHVDIHDVGMNNMEGHSIGKHFPSVAIESMPLLTSDSFRDILPLHNLYLFSTLLVVRECIP